MAKFKIGDKVKQKYKNSDDCIPELDNKIGKIVILNKYSRYYDFGVDFRFNFDEGHDLGGKLKTHTGRWYSNRQLELAEDKEYDALFI